MENIVREVSAEIYSDKCIDIESIVGNDNVYFYKNYPEGISNYNIRRVSLLEVLQDRSNVSDDVGGGMLIVYSLMKIKQFYNLHVLPSFDIKGQFSYSRETDDGDSKRVRTSFGRIMRRQYKITPDIIKDDVLAKINDILLQSIWNMQNMAKEVKGKDILAAYESYTGESCMSGDCSRYVELYAKNPDKVSLIITENEDGDCISKALLWRNDNDELILDRVYFASNKHMDSQAIISYAKQKGANVAYNSYSGRIDEGLGQVTLDITGCSYLPYMDTFRYAGSCKTGTDLKYYATFYNDDKVFGSLFHCSSTEGHDGIHDCQECGKTSVNNDNCCFYCGAYDDTCEDEDQDW